MTFSSLRSQRFTADILLLLAAIVWGGGFVAQRQASANLSFFSFNAVRFLLAGTVMLPFILPRIRKVNRSYLWILPAGILLYGGSALQQAGIETTSAGSAGFITGVYVVLVPLLLAVFWKVRTKPVIWLAALAALGGTYLLSTGGKSVTPSTGDLIVLAGSLVWAMHVIVVGFSVNKMDVFVFSVGQFLLCGLLHLGSSFFTTPPDMANIKLVLPSILYAGLGSIAIGFTLQAVGQKHAPASDAALLLSLEAVFAAIFGAFFLMERMNPIQILGCVIIMGAILGAQLIVLRSQKVEVLSPTTLQESGD
jgi:drug/metabolite transporter (DMT)-like permease